MLNTIKNAFKDKNVRRKILLTLLILFIYRIGCFVPIPGLSIKAVRDTVTASNAFLQTLSAITGGSLSNGTLFALGILPFINAFIIMQLLTIVIPALERLSKEGDEGRKKLTQITRYFAIGLAVIQSVGILIAWKKSGAIQPTFGNEYITMIMVTIILVAGSSLVMWLGERITEYGIGNGTSLIIFVGIISTFGTGFVNALDGVFKNSKYTNLWYLGGFILLVVALFYCIVFVDLAERRIHIQYAKQVKGNKMYGGQSTHIPIRVNSGGVMPIIFASAFLMFPVMIMSFWPTSNFVQKYNSIMGPGRGGYMAAMSILILFFAFFYAQIQFNPGDMARNIQQYGGFIPGIRPGKPTSLYLSKINNRIVLFGAIFLALIALIPGIGFRFFGESINMTNAFSATGLLIVVSVALEFDKQLESQLMMRHYKGFLK